jgi:hypothetical protein
VSNYTKANYPEGTRVSAPNPAHEYEIEHGVIIDNLSIMYTIRFDSGYECCVFKAAEVRELEEE